MEASAAPNWMIFSIKITGGLGGGAPQKNQNFFVKKKSKITPKNDGRRASPVGCGDPSNPLILRFSRILK